MAGAAAGAHGRRPRLWPPSRRTSSLLLTAALLVGVGSSSLVFADLGQAVVRALPALPAAVAVHLAQLAATAMAWRGLFHAPRPGFGLMLRARWIRESLNGLLPLVGIGGGVLAATAIARQTTLPFGGVAAGATVDLLIESVAQLPVLVAGLLILALLAPGLLPFGTGAALGLALLAGGAVLAMRLFRGAGRAWARRLVGRLGLATPLGELRASLAAVDAGTGAVLRAGAWHLLAWTLGALEVWVILAVLGVPVGLPAAFVIESLGMAARSLGFVLPAGLGAQEAGLAAVATALGVPPQEAIAMAMLKRLREVAMNLPGLVAWQWIERRDRRAGLAVPSPAGTGRGDAMVTPPEPHRPGG